ncbi:MAG: hypothetical protein LBU74_03105 [Methanobacteriaceae archaeon]|jgi:hypothetical protein|nr:hypothetical protein [Candidatus Methanorudis spinitermitis]
MNIKKIMIISLFLLIITSMTTGTIFASSEKIESYNSSKRTETYYEKIVTIDEVENNDGNYNIISLYYKIKIKKAYQNKFKIESVNCKYYGYETKNHFSKTYNGKNKISLAIIAPKNCDLTSMTINYKTKSKIKNERPTFYKGKAKSLHYYKFIGKKSIITLRVKGYDLSKGQGYGDITHQKFQIKTTNQKYKIKTINVWYNNMFDETTKTITYSGNGKTTLTKVIKEKRYPLEWINFKVTYY